MIDWLIYWLIDWLTDWFSKTFTLVPELEVFTGDEQLELVTLKLQILNLFHCCWLRFIIACLHYCSDFICLCRLCVSFSGRDHRFRQSGCHDHISTSECSSYVRLQRTAHLWNRWKWTIRRHLWVAKLHRHQGGRQAGLHHSSLYIYEWEVSAVGGIWTGDKSGYVARCWKIWLFFSDWRCRSNGHRPSHGSVAVLVYYVLYLFEL